LCVPFAPTDLALVARALDSAGLLLERGYGLRIEKAAGIGTARGFERAIARLAGLLRERAAPDAEAASRAAAGELALDWSALTPRAQARAVDRAAKAARTSRRGSRRGYERR